MPKDFKASQTRTSALIGSGTQGAQPGLLIYSASDATNFEGGHQADMLSDVGSDVFLFVSGAKNSRSGVTLFGGDIVISGSLYTENLIAEVDLSTTGSTSVSGSLFVSSSATLGGGLIVNNADDNTAGSSFTVVGSDQTKHLVHADPSTGVVYILSGGAAVSPDQTHAIDTAFFVSGSIGAKDSSTRAVAVFGGDVVISGSLMDAGGSPIEGSGKDTVGWFSGSSAVHNDLGIQPNFISTSGSLAVSGSMTVGSRIQTVGDPDTMVLFTTDTIDIQAGGKSLLKLAEDESAVSINVERNAISTIINTQNRVAFGANHATDQVLILSGGAKASPNRAVATDVGFYVSGSLLAKSGSFSHAVALIDGDTVISGALYVGGTGDLTDTGGTHIINLDDTNQRIRFYSSGYDFLGGDGGSLLGDSKAYISINDSTYGYVAVNPGSEHIGFRVNSDTERILQTNAGTHQITLGDSSTPGSDAFIFVSGAIGSIGSVVNSGSAVFGGDTVVSGALVVNPHQSSLGDLKVFGVTNDGAGQRKVHWDASDDNLHVHGKLTTNFANVTINEAGQAVDFRVETLNKQNAFLVDGSTNQILIHSGGMPASYNEAAGADVAFYVSGSVDSAGTSTRGTSLFGGDLAVSGSIVGVSPDGSSDKTELAMISDVITLGRSSDLKDLGSEVFFFVSGASPTGGGPEPSVALFDGRMVMSGGIYSIQNYPATGAHLRLNTIPQIAGDGGNVALDMLAGDGLETGDNAKFQISKAGPLNPDMNGGPWANVLKGNSGSMIFVVGSEPDLYLGNQSFVFRDMHGTFFMLTTGSAMTGGASVYFMSGGGPSSPNLVGADTNFVVSGAIGSAGTIPTGVLPGTSLFGGDLVASGTFEAKSGITGSITRISDGSSYLKAGDGVTITSASNGSITIAGSGGGGSATFASGSTSVSSVTSIDVSRLGLLMDLGSNQVAITGTIGESEDGTYSDGLFTTFDANTRIGHAIDKINEVLFYLSPSPAPNLSKIGTDGQTGVGTALMGIGSSNVGSSGYTVVGSGAGIGEARDINQAYTVTTSSNNIRMGVFTNVTTVTGELADGVAQNAYVGGVINHSGSAFGDADQGFLHLFINGAVRHSVDLSLDSVGAGDPGSGTDSQVDGNSNGFFNLSQTGSAVQANGQPFGLFKYRTGKVRIGTNYQRTGWNYAQVKHTINSVDRVTNQIEWFVDTGVAPNANQVKIQNIALSGSKYISGVQYATGANGEYFTRIDNFYDHVYAANPIQFNTARVDTVPNQTVPEVSSDANSYSFSLPVTASFQLNEAQINLGNLISGSVTFNFDLAHPTKTNMSTTGSIVSKEFLVYSASSLADDQFEDFVYETKRIISGAWNTQADVSNVFSLGAGAWNSELHLTSSTTGQSDGLIFYSGKLKAPKNTTGQSGNFKIFDTSFALDQGANSDQPNYSTGGAASGTKTMFRAFRNESGAAADNFKLAITGSGSSIVSKDGSLSTSNIRIYVRNPQNTGYLDLGKKFIDIHQTGQFQVDDFDGLRIGNFTSALGGSTVTNFGSFGTGSVPDNGYIVLKVEADADWTGNIDGMNVVFPAFDPSSIVTAPALDELDISTPSDFANGKLSFGSGKSSGGPAGYINVTGSAGPWGVGSNVDYNDTYTSSVSVGSNKRYGINSSNGTVEDVIGSLNGDVSSNGNNYTADSWRYANGGTLNLYVNQSGSGVSPIHSVDLSTFAGSGNPGSGTGTSVNSAGSGFVNVSVLTAASSSTGLPDFNNFFRTANFKVAGDDQNAKGWNWAQVVHVMGGGIPDEVTTFVEWVNDDDGNAVDIPSQESGSFHAASYYHQSGVKYFNTALGTVATGTVKYRVADAYTNVYSNSATALQFSTLDNVTAQGIFVTGSSITDTGDVSLSSNGTSLPSLTSGGDVTADIHVTGTLTYTGGLSLPGDSSPLNSFTKVSPRATLTVDHPIDTNDSQAVIFSNFLAYSGTVGSSNIHTVEKFTGEYFRMQSGSYVNQASSGSLRWDSTESLAGADAGHNTGLVVYGTDGNNGYLISPKSTALPNGGNFTNFADLNSPPDNVNYSGVSGEKHFFRTFKNNTTSDQAVISIVVKGDATLVPRTGTGSASLGTNKNVFIFVKIPGKTGWLDVGKPADGTITDGGGALQGDRDATIDSGGATNSVTFSTAFIGGDPSSDGSGEHFCIAIHADANWTGNIKEISVTF